MSPWPDCEGKLISPSVLVWQGFSELRHIRVAEEWAPSVTLCLASGEDFHLILNPPFAAWTNTPDTVTSHPTISGCPAADKETSRALHHWHEVGTHSLEGEVSRYRGRDVYVSEQAGILAPKSKPPDTISWPLDKIYKRGSQHWLHVRNQAASRSSKRKSLGVGSALGQLWEPPI